MKASSLVIRPCSLSNIRAFIRQHHYSHSVDGVKVGACFSVHAADGKLVGGVIYGGLSTTAWQRFADTEAKVLELRRLVLLDEAGRNSESRVVGWTLRWLTQNQPTVEYVVSYADPAYGHDGTIYKASNFVYLGQTAPDTGFRDPRTGHVYHSRALRTKYQGVYKPFVKRLRVLQESGQLEPVPMPGKHCFLYHLQHRRGTIAPLLYGMAPAGPTAAPGGEEV